MKMIINEVILIRIHVTQYYSVIILHMFEYGYIYPCRNRNENEEKKIIKD